MPVSLTLRPSTERSIFVTESPLVFYSGDTVTYAVTTTNLLSDPTSAVVTLLNKSSRVDVSATTLTGSATKSGDVITLPTVHTLIAGQTYLVYIKITLAGIGAPITRILELICRDS